MSQNSIAFVAEGQIPPSPPPTNAVGPVKWIKDNLFATITDSILTILSIAFLIWLASAALPWFIDSSWTPEEMSLKGCRAEASGACFAVIVERFWQYIFGFYPVEGYWRPTLAFVLMIVALWPVLFDSAPRKLLWLTMAYPVIAYFLIWGGSIWPVVAFAFLGLIAYGVSRLYAAIFEGMGQVNTIIVCLITFLTVGVLAWLMLPVFIGGIGLLLNFVLNIIELVVYIVGLPFGYAVEMNLGVGEFALPRLAIGALALALALGIAWLIYQVGENDPFDASLAGGVVGAFFFAILLTFLLSPLSEVLELVIGYVGLEAIASDKLGGFLLSLIIGVTGITASLPIGVALALGRQSKLLIVRTISILFIEFIRGVPLITLLFVASTLLAYFMPPGTTFDIILRVCIMVTLFASAYMAEVIRGGLAALPKGQYEAADAMGLTYWQSQRLIVLPQALKISIPNIVSNFIGLFKDTTLVIIIGLLDPLGLSTAIRADADWNGVFTELYLFVGLFFFIFCFGMSRYSMYLERKLATDHR